MNRRFRQANCTRCADGCPAAAITLSAGQPQLEHDQCVRCGLCLSACPTDVYQQNDSAESKLMETVRQLRERSLGLVCPISPTPEQTEMPVDLILRHSRCLGALAPAHLLALIHRGECALWLEDHPCTHCPIGAAHSTLVNTVATANDLLAIGGIDQRLYLSTTNTELQLPMPVTRPVIDGSQPKVSRRGLLGALRRAVHTVNPATPPAQNASPPIAALPVNQRLPQEIPVSRTQLLQHLQPIVELMPDQTATITTANLPFAAVQVAGDGCSACTLCARFCPTGAITLTFVDDEFSLQFQSSLCLDCDICVAACPEKVIGLGDTLSAFALFDPTPTLLAQGKTARCAGCGATTAVHPSDVNQPRCYACRQGAGPVTSLHDGAGLLTDLQRQFPI